MISLRSILWNETRKKQNIFKKFVFKIITIWKHIQTHTQQAHTQQAHTHNTHTHRVVESSFCQGTILLYDNRVRDKIMCHKWGKILK